MKRLQIGISSIFRYGRFVRMVVPLFCATRPEALDSADTASGQGCQSLFCEGLLTSNDVAGFTGMKVSVTLAVDPQNPNQVLIRSRQPNGEDVVALNDGSVQVQQKRR